MRLKIEMQADILNMGSARLRDGRMIWHLYTDMQNQFVHTIDVFPPARLIEKAERNMVAIIKVPELSPGENFSPSVILRIDTTTRDWLIEPKTISEQVRNRLKKAFSSFQKYWEYDDIAIQEISQQIAEKSHDDESYARHAHRTVRECVRLKTRLDERRGAARAAHDKEGDCDELADLFVALMRAVRIPARRVVGHVFISNPVSEPHAWCEVFLDRFGWIPVDPALDRFGVLTENYFSRIREGIVSERPAIQLRYSRLSSANVKIEESVKMTVVPRDEI